MDWYKEQWWNIRLFAQAALSIFFFSVVSCPLEASLSSSCEAPDSAGFGWKIRGGTLFLADYMCFKTFLENSHVRTCSLTRTMAHAVQRLSKKKRKNTPYMQPAQRREIAPRHEKPFPEMAPSYHNAQLGLPLQCPGVNGGTVQSSAWIDSSRLSPCVGMNSAAAH